MAAPWPSFEAARAEEAARVDAVEEYLRGATRARALPRARTLSPAVGVASARAAPKVRFADPVFVEPPPGSAGRAGHDRCMLDAPPCRRRDWPR